MKTQFHPTPVATASVVLALLLGISNIAVECYGGGGGGGGAHIWAGAGGGSGGAYVSNTVAVLSGTTYNLTVGGGGAGGNDDTPANGAPGNFSNQILVTPGCRKPFTGSITLTRVAFDRSPNKL